MRRQIVAIVISFLLVVAFSCSKKTADLVSNYPAVYNTHNVKDIVALYADDAVFEIVGQWALEGKDKISSLTQYDSVLNINMSISNIATRGDTAFCDLDETNDWLKTADIEMAHYKIKFIFKNGLIQRLSAESTPETQQAVDQVLSPSIKWASENQPDKLAEMMPEGAFVYNAKNAAASLALLKLWKESTQ